MARPPRFERAVKAPLGWLVERLAAPLARWDRMKLLTPEIPVTITGLPAAFRGYRIALVTDLHHGPAVPSWWLVSVADRLATLSPDVVVLGGDFVSNARSDLNGLQEILARIRGRDGVFAVLGNHDHWVGPEAVAAVVRGAGAQMLDNSHHLIRRGDDALALGGVGDFSHGAVRPLDAFRGVPATVPRVLISHNPDLVEYLPAGLRVDLVLSGHTHNGQLHLPWIGPLTVPSQFRARYLHGLHRMGPVSIYVSAGVGSGVIPIRWGNPPELPVLCLEPD